MTILTINNELNGIEIKFDEKPASETLATLKTNGFRWHRAKNLWYTKNTPERLQIAQTIVNGGTLEVTTKTENKKPKKTKNNIFGVKVGDIFEASWGYEQTNVDFFQVVELVGEKSVRVREVNLPKIEDTPVSGMSSDRVYKIINEILPPAPHSVFIKDQEKGDLKRIKPGYYKDEIEAKENCYFDLASYTSAHKCNGSTIKVYESWYY